MKTLKLFMGLAVLVTAISCVKTAADSEGSVSFVISADQYLPDVTKSNVSDYTELPQPDDFIITISNASGASVWRGKSSDWNSTTKLQVGEYTAKAVYGNIEEEGFDKPCFEGVQTFSVRSKETTQVEIPASLANTLIKISCTDDFEHYYKDYSFKLERNNMDIVTFAKGEERAAFVDGYKLTVAGTLTTETGSVKTFSREYTSLAAATAYNMIFDVAGVGNGTFTISFNNTVETVELADVELNDR
jgi:hypothetical protein